jgi:phosphoribosylformimino-5-aminoimidazole carboxamide ribotide isomerase
MDVMVRGARVRVIGVVDLRRGQAVHARAGRRELYAPVAAVAGVALEPAGDAVALARSYLGPLGVRELYVADLDAIAGGPPQRELIAALAALAAPLWLDAGVTTAEGARDALALGAARLVVGLETLGSFDALADICAAVGGARVVFSLDLRAGEPLAAPGLLPEGTSAAAIAARAAAAGVGALIVLDLARVGTGSGIDVELIGRVRAAAPGVPLLAGGGVSGPDDLATLGAAGCEGALVATALHDGRLGPREETAAGSARPPGTTGGRRP